MVIVDSSVMIPFLGGNQYEQTDWLNLHIGSEPVGITSLILTEVLQGIRGDRQFVETLEALNRFTIFETGGAALAIASARNYRTLRGLGFTVRNTVDTIVATFCIEEGHLLLHRDVDFDYFEDHLGLLVVDPLALAPK
jgi:predicted nucleic acid-binding protein